MIKILNKECYEYHKESLENYEEIKSRSVFQMTEQRAKEIRESLLKYRRENNIFEVGDKVVSKEDHELVKTVILISGGLARLKCLQFDHVYPLFDFRHATPEEIQAGRRLKQIKCWSCNKEMSHRDRAENDGFCVHCGVEIEL